jgi:hypothetical protein
VRPCRALPPYRTRAAGHDPLVGMKIPNSPFTEYREIVFPKSSIFGAIPPWMHVPRRSTKSFGMAQDVRCHVCERRTASQLPNLSKFFASLHVDEASFSTSVAELRAFVARRDASTVQTGCSIGLFAGQCCVDLSTVEDGRIVRPAERLDEICAVAQKVDTLLLKPHLFENDVRDLATLVNAVPSARMTQSNIYRILSDVNLKHVIALSSSVLDEAGCSAWRLQGSWSQIVIVAI